MANEERGYCKCGARPMAQHKPGCPVLHSECNDTIALLVGALLVIRAGMERDPDVRAVTRNKVLDIIKTVLDSVSRVTSEHKEG